MLNRTFVFAIIGLLSFGCHNNSSSGNQSTPVFEIVSENALTEQSQVDREELINFAKEYMGITYRSASIDPGVGFDCSGFVYFVFKHYGIDVPRSSREYEFKGEPLSPGEFKVGDVLVFYGYQDSTMIGHVGIICEANGMNSKFIHASSGKVYGVTISSLDSDGYKRRFFKCIDVISQ
jgi:cell wall-associated NlpC family hydrolase